jgi:hypothetical protein
MPGSWLPRLRSWTAEGRRATRAAENGATVNELMPLLGWKTEKMALLYMRKADRKRLAHAPAGTGRERKTPYLKSDAGKIAKVIVKSGA